MKSDEMFNRPDGDVILRANHRTDSRDFRVHKLLLSLTSPVFRDMFQLASSTSTTDIIDITDPPRAMEAILPLMYHSIDSSAIKDLTLLAEVLTVAEKYDIEIARSRFRGLLVEFASTEALRVYAIAYQLGYEDEMKVASSCSTSIHLPGLVRKSSSSSLRRSIIASLSSTQSIASAVETITVSYGSTALSSNRGRVVQYTIIQRHRQPIVESIRKGTPLNYKSLVRAVGESDIVEVEMVLLSHLIRHVLDKARGLNLTV